MPGKLKRLAPLWDGSLNHGPRQVAAPTLQNSYNRTPVILYRRRGDTARNIATRNSQYGCLVAYSGIPRTVVVIGCGIVGAASAYFLRKHGFDVTILDKEGPASAATGAADGAVSVASKRPGPMMEAALSGVALYRELLAEGVLSGLFKPRSTFILAASDSEASVLQAHADALSSAGVEVELIDRPSINRRFKSLSPAVVLGAEVKGDGHAIGYAIVHRLLTASGAMVKRGVETRKLVCGSDGVVIGVETSAGYHPADAVVIAAGGGAAKLLGLRQVLIPRKGQLLVTERAPALNACMPGAIMSGQYLLSKGSQKGGKVSKRGYGLVIDPLVTGQFLIGGTREDSDARGSNDLEAVSHVLREAVALVPDLSRLRLLRAFAGVRTAVADGLPLVGRHPGLVNVYVAAGFEGDGICLGPLMGRSIASLIAGRESALDLSAFDPGRFLNREAAA